MRRCRSLPTAPTGVAWAPRRRKEHQKTSDIEALFSEVRIQGEPFGLLRVAVSGCHDTSLLVLAHTFFEKVRLALQRDQLHPVEGIRGTKQLRVAQSRQQAIGHELDVFCHEVAVHPDEVARQRLTNELPLGLHCASDDAVHHILRQLVLQHAVEQACELAVQPLVTGDQLVGEGQARHQAALLQPIDGAERATEEDALDASEGHDALCEAALVVHPLDSPLCLLLDSGHGVDGVEDLVLLHRVLDVLLDEQRVRLRVDVLHGDLEAVEASRLRDLDLARETRGQVLQHDAVRGREKGEDVLHEVLLLLAEGVPILAVLRQVDLLRRPKGGLMFLVHLVDAGVLDREEHPAPGVLHEQGVRLLQFPELGRDAAHGGADGTGRCNGGHGCDVRSETARLVTRNDLAP
mmetsp:Transcript_101880/g.265950  ORF Transcript_101880/g.265950 Transcript_101880/m.265950 type:complete len:406 (+) Transcript_101880:274-1491(+)